jgi:hypothetical protein
VVQAIADYGERSAALTDDDYARWGYETLENQRELLAAFAGCKVCRL